jgi:diadenosine tetraphosphate (Ap4A) HIT family hydrolase
VRVVDKDEALARLHEHKQRLLADGGGCVMCALSSGAADLPFVAQNRHAVVLLDRFACRYGHLMVIPRSHGEHLSQLPWEVFLDVQRLTFEAAQAIDSCLKPARVFTATLGAAVELPMTYSHYHMHVIPVFETDERARPARVLSWSEGVVVYDDVEAREVTSKLAGHWPNRSGEETSGVG